MGTKADVSVVGVAGSQADALLSEAKDRLNGLERLWSRFLPDSEISQINGLAGRPVIVSETTFDLVQCAVDAWHLTGGAFDPTVGQALKSAGYDRTFDKMNPETEVSIAGYAPAPTPEAITLAPYPMSVRLDPGVQLDLGGIAKGMAADLLAEELLGAGASGCCVNIGGDLRVAGQPPRPEGWQVHLDCPGWESSLVIGVTTGAVCTSTTTKRRWRSDRGSEHHLRDPKTGASMTSGLVTATVISARAAQAEVLTKAILNGGSGAAETWFEKTETTGLTIDERGALTTMPGFDRFTEAALSGRRVA